jgi:hypothetical protein
MIAVTRYLQTKNGANQGNIQLTAENPEKELARNNMGNE